ncbi:hypothetical protein D7Y23_04295 [Corallococcus sp. AB050B]|nr:hypothetical protein D7Y23_04295 [Corallococcus sp. AB050B]
MTRKPKQPMTPTSVHQPKTPNTSRSGLFKNPEDLRKEMETLAEKLKDLILTIPPESLIGALWVQLTTATSTNSTRGPEHPLASVELLQFTLEYVHAVLSCFSSPPENSFSAPDSIITDILSAANDLKGRTLDFCLSSSRLSKNSDFGDHTSTFEFRAKSTWVLIRGLRHQVLEEEFFSFVLAPHEDALRAVYGVGASEIAAGAQTLTNSMRSGLSEANEIFQHEAKRAFSLSKLENIAMEKAIENLATQDPATSEKLRGAIEDIFYGGVCNLSRHTSIPPKLLEDLAFTRGEASDFFASGEFRGTPMRTLPARVKPLIQLANGYYAVDPSFARDSFYRALQRGLAKRLPDYKNSWNERQKKMSEDAFAQIFKDQLRGARVINEIYYRDPKTGDWAENDTIIIFEDTLIQVEAKAGLAAMHSPETDFQKHKRAVENLVLKAYRQTKRFLEYLHSNPDAPIFELRDGEYIEKHRINISQYRLIIPIGLTVESFAPFSTICKDIPEVAPILEKHPFISMSIDDLFVLTKFLPTTGELFHYLDVRQKVAGIRNATLFDESDHLGAYILNNRVDETIADKMAEGFDYFGWDGASDEIDKYFWRHDWKSTPPPSQKYPRALSNLLQALAQTRSPGWLRIDSLFRNLGGVWRENLAHQLSELSASLSKHPYRHFLFSPTSEGILVCITRERTANQRRATTTKAQALGIALDTNSITTLELTFSSQMDIVDAAVLSIQTPVNGTSDYAAAYGEVAAMRRRVSTLENRPKSNPMEQRRDIRPNDMCWCGSGKKFKKCHRR